MINGKTGDKGDFPVFVFVVLSLHVKYLALGSCGSDLATLPGGHILK